MSCRTAACWWNTAGCCRPPEAAGLRRFLHEIKQDLRDATAAVGLDYASPRRHTILVTALPPDIKLVFEDRPGYLYAAVSGPRDSKAISIAYWTLVAEQCRLRKARKVMVVENLGDHEDDPDLPALVDAVIAMGMDRLQVAFVAGRIDQIAQMEHGEILAAERGANGRVFGSVTVAERWLRHGGH